MDVTWPWKRLYTEYSPMVENDYLAESYHPSELI